MVLTHMQGFTGPFELPMNLQVCRHHYREPNKPRMCVLMDNGLVKCYGQTANGASGQPDTVSRRLPTLNP